MRFEEVVNKYYNRLNENDLYILKIICADKNACKNLSINALAKRCNVSRTTIMRFSQKLGFSGYGEFKVFFGWEATEKTEVTRDSSIQILYHDIEIIEKGLNTIVLREICHVLQEAKRVFVYGTGTAQQQVAKELQRVFLMVRKYLHVIEGETELQNVVRDMKKEDAALIISYSGNKIFLHDIVHTLQMNDVKYISVTTSTNNFLAQNTKYNLYIPSTALNLPTGEQFHSTVLFFLMADILFREYIQQVSIHPRVEGPAI